MIVTQTPYIDENGTTHENLVRHYSDQGMYILQVQTGIEYTEAVDVVPCRYTYTETDRPIDSENFGDDTDVNVDPDEISDSEALAIITGGAE